MNSIQERGIALAKWLVAGTLLYNVAEGIVSIWAGVAARSVALVAFGADSYLEVAAATLVLWRLAATGEAAEEAEGKARRFIGWTFIILAGVVIAESVFSLLGGKGASESFVGIGVAVASLVVMPAVAFGKLRVAHAYNMGSLAAEAKETLACSFLSGTLLIGLAANAVLGWWWLDAVTALLLTPWLIKEGLEGIRGEHDED